MIKIRKLVAVDMAWLGARLTLAEYALGIVLPLALGILSVRAGRFSAARWGWETILGLWLIGIAANYIPLFVYAVLIARAGTVVAESCQPLPIPVRADREAAERGVDRKVRLNRRLDEGKTPGSCRGVPQSARGG